MRPFSRRARAVALAAALSVHVAPLLGGLPAARARVNPLKFIERQIHKPNMLIVLDTSGSMTGVPGGTFQNSSEVGVDCDDGDQCRGWTKLPDSGLCSKTGRSCTTSADCTTKKYCKIGLATCTSNADCSTQGYCEKGNSPCSSDADCSAKGIGFCTASGESCSAGVPCKQHGNCSLTPTGCGAPGKACKAGWCQHEKDKACESDRDCGADGPGSCAFGKTPKGGCLQDSECPPTRLCSTGEPCWSDFDCPKITAGTCLNKGIACTTTADCQSGNDFCIIPKNVCTGDVNWCELSYKKCIYSSGNTCLEVPNACAPAKNLCIKPTSNTCETAAADETCEKDTSIVGAMRMCQRAQSLCASDVDCPPGDRCGPPTSRAVVAKRTLGRVIEGNYGLVNLGLMTFFQSGYFSYREQSGAAPAFDPTYLPRLALEPDCFVAGVGPSPGCTWKGLMLALSPGSNSRYSVINKDGTRSFHDAVYCGEFCELPDLGTAKYEGSYYLANGTAGTETSTKKVFAAYQGKSFVQGAKSYRYPDSRPDMYNGGPAPPIKSVDCGSTCSATCGGRWDEQLSPFIDPEQSEEEARAAAVRMLEWMAKASQGGLITYGGTPSGCTLMNDVVKTENASAYHYMTKLKAADPLACRQNYVLFITDGEANGPGDSNCTSSKCAADNPEAAGCTCKVVRAAWELRKQGVRTFVVGFSTDTSTGNAMIINDNVAKAGGTDQDGDGKAPYAFSATNEVELEAAIQNAIYEAVRGSYSTSPATSSSGVQMPGQIKAGRYALDARVDFPSWEGHLIAYDTAVSPPQVAWDANTELKKMNWWERRVYVGTHDGNAIRILVDPLTKTVTNKEQLSQLGFGATPEEAGRIAKFILGDPDSGNRAVLGAMINSTPIDVGQPGNSPFPGGAEFYAANKARPSLTYVGASDGMLHAFFTDQTKVGNTTYAAGAEAFAYIPPSMFRVAASLYAQGGQVADPRRHIFGLANSPKVKSLCIKNCTDSKTAVWKTVLVMNEGYGGAGMFVLDITSPLSEAGFADPPVLPIWHSNDPSLRSAYLQNLGLSISVPGFFFNKTETLDDHRLVFASGYRALENVTTQGKRLVVASAATGQILDHETMTTATSCDQEYGILADVATAKDFTKDEQQKLRAAYFGDTWGQIWRYDGASAKQLTNLGCAAPLHFAPTVVQLDRDDPKNRAGEVFLVQVTNSALDDATAKYPPSEMHIIKEVVGPTGQLQADLTFGTNGKILLKVGTDGICAVTGEKGACTQQLPLSARPTATPMAILKRDGTGFQLFTMWYAQDLAGCGKGTTWLTIHEVTQDVTLKQAIKVGDEPVTSPVIVGGKVFVVGSNGALDIGGNIDSVVSTGGASPVAGLGTGLFNLLGWTELD